MPSQKNDMSGTPLKRTRIAKKVKPLKARQVTMADVGMRVGVSAMTVSRALNQTGANRREKSEALRQRILNASFEMGYVIDQTAKGFSRKQSGFVSALIPALDNTNFSQTAHGLTAALEGSGLQVLLGYTDYDLACEEKLLQTMLSRRPEAVFITGGVHTSLTRNLLMSSGIPVVEAWDIPANPIEHTIGFSNAEAMAQMVFRLHALGYKRMAFLGGAPESDPRGADRRRGFEQALKQLQLDPTRTLIVGRAPVSMEHGAQGVVALMERWPDTDALICVSDHPAVGALAECHRRGWAVPGKIAVVGFGGFEVSAACHPRISTVSVDAMAIGKNAGNLLLRAIEAARLGSKLEREIISVPYRIELRDST